MKRSTEKVLVVFVTARSARQATKIGHSLVVARLAACAMVFPGGHSVYRWRGKVVKDRETVLMLKTTAARYRELEKSIRGEHSYEIPEIIAVSIKYGLPQYLEWVVSETTV